MPIPANMQQSTTKTPWLPGLALAAMLLGLAGCGLGDPKGYSDVTASQLHAQMQQGDASGSPLMIVDVRTPQEYRSGHIRGALLLPVNMLEEHLSEVPRNRAVYVYCQAGARSARAASLLVRHGYTRINNLQGGIAAWQRAGYKVVK